MKDFARLQSEFQRAILEGDLAVLDDIMDSPQEKRGVLFDVYRNAYVLRLIEAMGTSYELLYRYMGDEMFAEMGAAFVAQSPSHNPNMRWYARPLPRFLAETEPYADYPILADLANLENALNDAFDAPDSDVLSLDALQAIDPSSWHDLVFTAHPSARRFDFSTNALDIWSALRDDVEVPEAVVRDAPQYVLVWRQDGTAMVRALEAEEAMMWDEATKGIPFGQLCTMLATYDDPGTAAARAAGYLGPWVQAETLAKAVVD